MTRYVNGCFGSPRWVLAAIVLLPHLLDAADVDVAERVMRSRDPAAATPLRTLVDAYRRPRAQAVLTWLANSAIVVGATSSAWSSRRWPATVCRVSRVARNRARLPLLVSKMLPSSLIVIPFFIGFFHFGLIDSRWGLIVATRAVGSRSRPG